MRYAALGLALAGPCALLGLSLAVLAWNRRTGRPEPRPRQVWGMLCEVPDEPGGQVDAVCCDAVGCARTAWCFRPGCPSGRLTVVEGE